MARLELDEDDPMHLDELELEEEMEEEAVEEEVDPVT